MAPFQAVVPAIVPEVIALPETLPTVEMVFNDVSAMLDKVLLAPEIVAPVIAPNVVVPVNVLFDNVCAPLNVTNPLLFRTVFEIAPVLIASPVIEFVESKVLLVNVCVSVSPTITPLGTVLPELSKAVPPAFIRTSWLAVKLPALVPPLAIAIVPVVIFDASRLGIAPAVKVTVLLASEIVAPVIAPSVVVPVNVLFDNVCAPVRVTKPLLFRTVFEIDPVLIASPVIELVESKVLFDNVCVSKVPTTAELADKP